MSITISDFKTHWQLHTGEDLPSDDVVYDLLFDIDQQIYEEIVGRYAEKYIATQSISVVSGTSSYPLDNANLSLKEEGTGLFRLDSENRIIETYSETGFGSRKKGFYIDGTNLIITPEPGAAVTLALRYIPDLVEYDDDDDTLFLPSKSIRIYRRWFSYLIHADDEEYNVASVQQQFANEAANQIYRNFAPTGKAVILRGGTSLLQK